MQKYFYSFLFLCCVCSIANAQQGARVGVIAGVANTSIQNKDDKNASAILKAVPTFYFQKGLEVGYFWRFLGISTQLMWNKSGQNYTFYGQKAGTEFNYLKPTFLIHFNSNPKNDFRFSGFIGAGYGILRHYTDYSQITDPITKAITYTTFKDKTFTIKDTGSLSGTLGDGIYYPSDATVIAGLGLDVRVEPQIIFGIHARFDMGMEKLENYNKIKEKYIIDNTTYTYDYEHWKNLPNKYNYQYTYNNARTPSNNMSYGVYLSLKYIIKSKAVREYERYGY